ncbi:MAG: GMP synthase (glutamine-hydrolyzing), partial [Candidatus Binatia bacterium]
MPRLLVLQHVAHEILGTLDPLLRGHGFRIRYVNFDRHPDAVPSIDGYDGVVVLGGPMSADDSTNHPHLATEVDVLRTALERDMPILGICLGAQLLALALGGQITRNHRKEIGWYPVSPTAQGLADPLIGEFGPTEPVFHWHGDTFSIPNDAVHLATSQNCTNQAFRYGDNAWGFQFHLEVDEPMIERWLRIPIMRDEMDSDADTEHADV